MYGANLNTGPTAAKSCFRFKLTGRAHMRHVAHLKEWYYSRSVQLHSKEHLWCKGKFSRGRKEIGEERESKTARRLTQITPVFRETNQQFSKKTTTVACFFLIIEREEIAGCVKKLKLFIRKRES